MDEYPDDDVHGLASEDEDGPQQPARTTFAWIGDDEDDVMPFSSPEVMAVPSAPVA